MYCPNCGNGISSNDRYCPNCGNKLVEGSNPSINTQSNYEDEELLKAYIGNNYDSIINSKFNFPAFIIGGIYLLYRKCYLFFFLLIIATLFFPYFVLIYAIILGFCFNTWYIKKAKNDILRIKTNNSNATTSELLNLVGKKGGTGLVGPIIYIVINVIIVTLFILLFAFLINTVDDIRDWSFFEPGISDNYFDEDIYSTDNYNGYSEGKIKILHYYVPNNYAKIEYKEDIAASYQYRYSDSICKFEIYVVTNEIDNMIDSFQRGTPPEERLIKDTTYNYIEYYEDNSINSIYYTKKKGALYVLEFQDNNDVKEKCPQGREELFNSITYSDTITGESPDYA